MSENSTTTPSARFSPKMAAMRPDVLYCDFSTGAGYAMDWHSHDCHMLLIPRRGGLLMSTEDSSEPMHLTNRSFAAVGFDVGHATAAASDKESHITLYVQPDYLPHYGAKIVQPDLQALITGQGPWVRSEIMGSILELYGQFEDTVQSDSFSGIRRRSTLHHLNHLLFEECVRIITQSNRLHFSGTRCNHNLLVRQVQQFIDENLEIHHNIETLSRQFLLSRRHLTRLFRDVAGESIIDYSNRRRVERAQQLIGEEGMSILQAGLAVGIESPSYLTRLFKKYLGLLPSACRRAH